MQEPKIDEARLRKLVLEQKSGAEIAAVFKVSRAAVSKAISRFGLRAEQLRMQTQRIAEMEAKGIPHAEIAKTLGIKRSTVYKRAPKKKAKPPEPKRVAAVPALPPTFDPSVVDGSLIATKGRYSLLAAIQTRMGWTWQETLRRYHRAACVAAA